MAFLRQNKWCSGGGSPKRGFGNKAQAPDTKPGDSFGIVRDGQSRKEIHSKGSGLSRRDNADITRKGASNCREQIRGNMHITNRNEAKSLLNLSLQRGSDLEAALKLTYILFGSELNLSIQTKEEQDPTNPALSRGIRCFWSINLQQFSGGGTPCPSLTEYPIL